MPKVISKEVEELLLKVDEVIKILSDNQLLCLSKAISNKIDIEFAIREIMAEGIDEII